MAKKRKRENTNIGEEEAKKDWWTVLKVMPSACTLLGRFGVEDASSLQELDDVQLHQLVQCMSKGDAKRFLRDVKSGEAVTKAASDDDAPSSSSLVEPNARPAAQIVGHHPFEVDPLDHCETDLRAYQDVATLLDEVAPLLGRTNGTLRIYDPYYCDGGVKQRLANVGFPTVYNECEDFYDVVARGKCPEHDIIVTVKTHRFVDSNCLGYTTADCLFVCFDFRILLTHKITSNDASPSA